MSWRISDFFGWYEVLRLAPADLHFKENVQNFLLSIFMKFIIVGSSASSHLVFDIWIFRINICLLLKHFDKYYCMFLM